ncbi:MAG: hypothetical protein PHG40_01345 [Candidatus Omnitrophica bacterium]|nr:hypothetical protein [Candidatus Omnitrophota bacterium]
MPVKMKLTTIIFCFLISAFCLLPSVVFAAPCYGTKMPEAKNIFMGLQTHSILKRNLEGEYGRVRSTQHFLNLSYGINNRISLDLKGGIGDIGQHPLDSAEVDYPNGFAGGYGFRLGLYDKNNIKAVFGFQHISVHPQSTHVGDTKNQAILDDWQVSALTSYTFKRMTPYLGIKWSRTDYIHRESGNRKRKMSDLTRDLGAVIGCDIYAAENIWFNLEGQFIDSRAVAVGVNLSF